MHVRFNFVASLLLLATACGQTTDGTTSADGGESEVVTQADTLTPGLESDVVADGAPAVDAGTSTDGASIEEERPTAPASEAMLLDTKDVTWSKITAGVLLSSAVKLQLCTDHFPVDSKARAEVLQAAKWYAGVADVSVTITAGPHRPKAEMYLDDAEKFTGTMDYVTEGYPCHKVLACSNKYEDGKKIADGFSLNVCKCRKSGCFGSNSSGKVVGFAVAVNSLCKSHFKNPKAGDYPKAENVAHEFGHGFGMIHTPSWPLASRGLVSTMQGNLHGLGVVDWAMMRHHYGGPDLNAPQLRPSPLARVAKNLDDLSKGFRRVAFSTKWNLSPKKLGTNPEHLYFDGEQVLDCDTDQPPKYTMTWFNLGSACPKAAVHRLVAHGPNKDLKVTLLAFNAPAMPRLSQDSWRGQATLTKALVSGLPTDVALTTQLELDALKDCEESDESDNTISGNVTFHSSKSSCPK